MKELRVKMVGNLGCSYLKMLLVMKLLSQCVLWMTEKWTTKTTLDDDLPRKEWCSGCYTFMSDCVHKKWLELLSCASGLCNFL